MFRSAIQATIIASSFMAAYEKAKTEQQQFNIYLSTIPENERALAIKERKESREKEYRVDLEQRRHEELVEAARPKGVSAALAFVFGLILGKS